MTLQSLYNGQHERAIAHADLGYAESLYLEGLGMPDERLREEHLKGVAELIGDMSLYEALGEKVTADRQATLENIETSRMRRATIAADNIETQGFAYEAPNFREQVQDSSRSASFTYSEDVKHGSTRENQREATEFEGLQELQGFLDLFLQQSREFDGSYRYPALADQAQSMLDNLTFIGEKEYTEAVHGLEQTWKKYLDADPNRQICVLADISDSEKYPGQRKSDDYLRDNILAAFTDEELAQYSGRIVKDVDDLTVAPPDARVVLLDDWSITGSQIRREYAELSDNPTFRQYANAGSVEVNLLVSSAERVEHGLEVEDSMAGRHTLPVRAYYQAHPADVANGPVDTHITGLHSSVNYGFEEPINKGMVKVLGRLGKLKQGRLPIGLANVVRPYRDSQPSVEITATRLSRMAAE